MTRQTQLLDGSHEALETAVALLRDGDLVAFPTETVYGLGADARQDDAVERIYFAKQRPAGNPLIVHVADRAAAEACVSDFPETARHLARRFWPGPLTMILPRGPGISPRVSAGRETVALRVPAHPLAHKLLEAFGGPIAAPSANRAGQTSPTSAQDVWEELSGRIGLILDGGPCQVGLESTVLDLSGPVPVILRPGSVTAEMIGEVLGELPESRQEILTPEAMAECPGQAERHYAPRTPAFRFDAQRWPMVEFWIQSTLEHRPAVLLTTNTHMHLPAPHQVLHLSSHAEAYAHELYRQLRHADTLGMEMILVAQPPAVGGLWDAIHDRLRRATLPLRLQISSPMDRQ